MKTAVRQLHSIPTMKNKSYLLSAAITGGGMAFFQLSNFLLGVFIVRYVSVQELGHYQFFVVTATFMSYFAKMGGDEKISYMLPAMGGANSHDGRALMTTVLVRTIFLSLAVVLIYELFGFFIADKQLTQQEVIDAVAYSIYLPSFVGGLILTSILRAEHRMFARSLFIYVLPNIFNFIFILIIVALLFAGSSSILARSVSYLLLFVLLFILLQRQYGFAVKARNGKDKKNHSGNAGWLMVTVVSFSLESGLLVIWAGKYFLNDYENGVLAILLRLSALVLLVPTAVNIVMGPVLAKQPEDKELRIKIFKLNAIGVMLVFLGIVPLGGVLLSFFGDEYTPYKGELFMLLVGFFLLAVTQPMYSMFMAAGKKSSIFIPGVLLILVYLIILLADVPSNINGVVTGFSVFLSLFVIVRVSLFKYLLDR